LASELLPQVRQADAVPPDRWFIGYERRLHPRHPEEARFLPPFAGTGDDWAAQYRAAGARATAAWADDAKLGAIFAVPWGKVPGRVAVAGYVREVLAHGWDLAVATGQETELDPELGAFALDVSQRSLPASGREGTWPPVAPAASGRARPEPAT
jgi:uncharacterized protein (TIGR03086 family)